MWPVWTTGFPSTPRPSPNTILPCILLLFLLLDCAVSRCRESPERNNNANANSTNADWPRLVLRSHNYPNKQTFNKKPASSCSWIRLQIWKAKFPHSQNGSKSAFQRHFAYGPLSAPTQQRSKRWHVSATLIDQAGYCSRSRTIARALTTTDKRRTNRHVENRWNSRSFAATITQRIKRFGASSWWRART